MRPAPPSPWSFSEPQHHQRGFDKLKKNLTLHCEKCPSPTAGRGGKRRGKKYKYPIHIAGEEKKSEMCDRIQPPSHAWLMSPASHAPHLAALLPPSLPLKTRQPHCHPLFSLLGGSQVSALLAAQRLYLETRKSFFFIIIPFVF